MKILLANPNETKTEKLEYKTYEITPRKKKQLIDSISNLLTEIKNTNIS